MSVRDQVTIFFILVIQTLSFGQVPSIEWERSYGGSKNDRGYCIEQTSDGGYIIAGSTRSDDGDITNNLGNFDVWVVKIDLNGEIVWENTYGGPNPEEALSIKQTRDGGYILAGSYSIPDTNRYVYTFDCLVMKLDSTGKLEWQRVYGGAENDVARGIEIYPDGSYLVLAQSNSFDGDVTGHQGFGDIWLFKLDTDGMMVWNRCYGGPLNDNGFDINRVSDGFIIVGSTESIDGDIFSNDGNDAWVLKIDDAGSVVWETAVGKVYTDRSHFFAVYQTKDGGVIAGGGSSSNDSLGLPHQYKHFVVKLDAQGAIIWHNTYNMKAYGGSIYSILETVNGGILMVGKGVTENTYGANDYLVRMLNEDGELQWEMNFGGSRDDAGKKIIQTNDGGFVIAGTSESSDNDVSVNRGLTDIWVVKLSPVPFRIMGKAQVCLGDAIRYKTNLPYNTNWYINEQFQGYSDSLVYSFGAEGKQTLIACYTLMGTSYCDTLSVQVYEVPNISLPDSVYSCEPFSKFVCPFVSANELTYLWHDGAGDSCRTFNHTGQIWLTVSNPACSATDSSWLIENKNPSYQVVQLDTFCLEGSNYNRITLVPNGFSSISWNGGDGSQPIYWIYQNQMISVEVIDSNNCKKLTEFQPLDGCNTTFFIPNSFTPNGDGLNDVFSVSGSRIESVHLRIYNRWGQQVFESKEVERGWDGSLQGNPCPQDIYYYLVEYSGYWDNVLVVKSEKGIIHLLR